LGPLGTAATNRPIVPAPGDYVDGDIGGMMIGRGNRSTRRKPIPVPHSPQVSHAYPSSRLECFQIQSFGNGIFFGGSLFTTRRAMVEVFETAFTPVLYFIIPTL
jgi:hypothetical protein